MTKRTRISGAFVVLPTETVVADVMIENGRIADIDAAKHLSADHEVSAKGLHLLPGVVDDQVHFREPGLTHKEDLQTASFACAKGGITSYLEMPNTLPTTTTVERLEAKIALAGTKSLVNFGFYLGATPDNLTELQAASRTPGIKIFIGSSTGDLLVDDQADLERIFAETTLPITAHCEDESTVRANRERIGTPVGVADHSRIRDHQAALLSTKRALDLAYRHRHRFHVLHTSTAAETELFADHQQLITAEACPHHLLFHTGDYERLGTLVQMNPSLKSPADNQALWAALLDNRIQVIATDHAPHTWDEKQQPYPQSPSGLPAVENSLALMLDQTHQGRCTLQHVVHWMCDAPARVWDIIDRGRIERGYAADLVLVDLNLTKQIRNQEQLTKCGWSPWHGQSLTGWPVMTFVGGHCVYDRGRFDDSQLGQEIRFDHQRGGYWAT